MSAKPFTASLQGIEHKGEVEAAQVAPSARQQWTPFGLLACRQREGQCFQAGACVRRSPQGGRAVHVGDNHVAQPAAAKRADPAVRGKERGSQHKLPRTMRCCCAWVGPVCAPPAPTVQNRLTTNSPAQVAVLQIKQPQAAHGCGISLQGAQAGPEGRLAGCSRDGGREVGERGGRRGVNSQIESDIPGSLPGVHVGGVRASKQGGGYRPVPAAACPASPRAPCTKI